MKRGTVLLCCGTLAAAALLLVWVSADRARQPEHASPAAASASERDVAPAPQAFSEEPALPASDATQDEAARAPVAPAGVCYRGTVVDAGGEPIAGATLRAAAPGHDAALADTRSDERGAFSFTAARDWPANLWVQASAAGYAQAIKPLDGFEPNVITLPWLTELHGQVRDAQTQQPIAGASVCWERRGESGRGTTQGDGCYRLRDVPVDDITVRASAPGHARRTVQALLRTRAPAQLDFALDRGTPLSVQAVDRATELPIAGAVVTEGSERLAETDRSGCFELCVAPGQELCVAVQAADYAPLFWTWTVAEIPASVRLPLARWGFIEGRVVDDAGGPLSDVTVRIEDNAHMFFFGGEPPEVLSESEKSALAIPGRLPGFAWETRVSPRRPDNGIVRTDGSGRFSVAVVPSSAHLIVEASRRAYAFATLNDVVVRAGGERVWLDLVGHATARIHGRATRNGAPCRGRVVWRLEGSPGAVASGDVRPDGTYEIETDRAGEGTLVLFRTETLGEAAHANLVVELGESHEQDLSWVEAMARITGRISDPNGAVPAGVAIHATRGQFDSGPPITAEIAADGTYALPVPAGPAYDVVAQRGAVRQKREAVAAGATGIDFAFPELAAVELRIVDEASGAPLASLPAERCRLSWRASGAQEFEDCSAHLDVNGSCVLELPVGRVDLCLELGRAGYVPRVVAGMQVAAGPNPPIAIALERGADVTLRLRGERELTWEEGLRHVVFLLRDEQQSAVKGPFALPDAPRVPRPPSNQNIHGVYVWLRDPLLMHQIADFDRGNAELRGLAPGRYALRAFPDDLGFDPPEIEVTAPSCTAEVRWMQR